MSGKDKFAVYQNLKTTITDFLQSKSINPQEVELFNRLLQADIYSLDEAEIQSTGYVLHALEASIWCLLKTDNYKEAVLKAVNLGDDTDTTAAITGGLAGILYGYQSIPERWINRLARLYDITSLSERLGERFNS